MKNILVNKEELKDILKENRRKHREIFEAAQVGYRKEAVALLDKALENARTGKDIKMYFSLDAPVDQTKDYDRVIRMLNMSVEETLELSEVDFAQYVLDDWSWKMNFMSTNSKYTKI